MKKEKIDVVLVECFDDNKNHWEWATVIRKESFNDKELKEIYADFYGMSYNDDEEDKKFVDENYEENTRVNHLIIKL